MEIDDIRSHMREIERVLISTKKQLTLAIDAKNRLSNKMYQLTQQYRDLDLRLAKLDGRFKVIKPKESKVTSTSAEIMKILSNVSGEELKEFKKFALNLMDE